MAKIKPTKVSTYDQVPVTVGHGYEVSVTGDRVVITIDIAAATLAAAPLTSTKRSKLVATTRGQWVNAGPLGLQLTAVAR